MRTWNEKLNKLRPIRDKRLSLKIQPNETYSEILISVMKDGKTCIVNVTRGQ